jgi:ribosomal protein S18 acetylase RimI-like enzyme
MSMNAKDDVTRAQSIRPLAREDLDTVVAIDAEIEGYSRRGYFERRLGAALREPKLHAQFAAVEGKGLAGYILSRVMEGEFGRSDPALRLETIGVRSDFRGSGVGKRLLDALCEYARRHGIVELRTLARWNDHDMLRWLDRNGFALAVERVVDCPVRGGEYLPQRDDPRPPAEGPVHEIDYGAQSRNDFERLARDNAEVSAMARGDLPDIVRIDRGITGRDRTQYMQQKVAEAMVDSAIRVSLTARIDGIICGFLMARVDLGDFGRTEPVAVLDTIDVDPDYAHRGVGHALISQLFVNLGGLRVERVETSVAPRDFGLLGFLYDIGFSPSQRLAFSRRLG